MSWNGVIRVAVSLLLQTRDGYGLSDHVHKPMPKFVKAPPTILLCCQVSLTAKELSSQHLRL